jgi:hypothetical protein
MVLLKRLVDTLFLSLYHKNQNKDKMNNQKLPFRLDSGQIEVIDELMVEVFKNKSPYERLQIASTLWWSAKQYLFASIARFHPEWNHKMIHTEVIKRLSHGTI